MLAYYIGLAARSLARSPALTLLTTAAIAVGISACMVTLTVYRGMAADPIPRKSQQLFAPQIDNWGPVRIIRGDTQLADRLSYTDAQGLLRSPLPQRQAAMYAVRLIVTPHDPQKHAFEVAGRATSSDFFAMFAVPLLYGAPWTLHDDADRAQVVVLSRDLNERLFDGRNSVGATLRLSGADYRVVGVLDDWQPLPRFYDLDPPYAPPEDLYIPYTRAIQQQLPPAGNWACNITPPPGWPAFLGSDCDFLSLWVELPTAAAARAYRGWLASYATEQQRNGRFHWSARTALPDVRQWLAQAQVVSGEVQLLVLLSFAFLAVCLMNAMGLMLARIVAGRRDLAVRRALGARRRAVLIQCLVETGVVGLTGGLGGLALTAWLLQALRQLLSEATRPLLHLDATDVALTVLLAVVATLVAGLYPTVRAVYVPPAPELKTL